MSNCLAIYAYITTINAASLPRGLAYLGFLAVHPAFPDLNTTPILPVAPSCRRHFNNKNPTKVPCRVTASRKFFFGERTCKRTACCGAHQNQHPFKITHSEILYLVNPYPESREGDYSLSRIGELYDSLKILFRCCSFCGSRIAGKVRPPGACHVSRHKAHTNPEDHCPPNKIWWITAQQELFLERP
ncbi:hypothetical protein CC78DRAFT_307723 [Lojkania enalia]|uniref:Uncharacterized protein n=1 Tax=Lojkania enalia TaxID=147567 RepID=A0A9P4N9U6_9PLEO|nr:hypothetical protein CC78DRAFT_307723 [Didymosphaeria enalia]